MTGKSAKGYKERRQIRRPLVQALYTLGIKQSWICKQLGAAQGTVRKDIGGVENQRDEEVDSKVVFAAVVKRYAELLADVATGSQLLRECLSAWLQMPQIRFCLQAFEMTMEKLVNPKQPEELQPYVDLVYAIFFDSGKQTLLGQGEQTLKRYFSDIAAGSVPPPTDQTELQKELAGRFVGEHRSRIKPILPSDYKDRVNHTLATLQPREEKILRMRFGLTNGVTYTLKEVGREIGVTHNRIRQIETKALRKLRHPLRKSPLRALAECACSVPSLSPRPGWPQILDAKVEDVVELSVRATSGLQNAGIKTVRDLVQMTAADLLRTKNVGRVSLKEICEWLVELGTACGHELTLGMFSKEEPAAPPPRWPRVLDLSVEELGLETRLTRWVRQYVRAATIGELAQKTRADLFKARYSGAEKVGQAERALKKMGERCGHPLQLGMNVQVELHPPLPVPDVLPLSAYDALGGRIHHYILYRAGIRTVGDLVRKTERDLLKVPGFGHKKLLAVRELLAKLSARCGRELTLGMSV